MSFRKYSNFIILALFFFMSGCAYQLRYSVSTMRSESVSFGVGGKTFALQTKQGRNSANYAVEEELLYLIEQSLLLDGWQRVSRLNAAYVFSVDFKPKRRLVSGELQFGAFPGKKTGVRIGSEVTFGGREYSEVHILIMADASENRGAYVWSAECITRKTNQEVTALAKHIIPFALAQFPEEGRWEKKEKVKLHKSIDAPGSR
jgi:hypothetical protein